MMRALIVEDEEMAVKRLLDLLDQCNYPVSVLQVCDSIRGTVQWLDNNQEPEILFLDIQLSDGSSFEIFEQRTVNCPVIFTTAFDEYAIRAFKQNSIDYLLKPFQLAELQASLDKFSRLTNSSKVTRQVQESLERMYEKMEQKYKSRFFVKSRNKAYSIQVANIELFTYEHNAVLLCNDTGKKFLIRYSLDELQTLLDPEQFFRINRKQIVNIAYIERIDTSIKTKLGVVIPITDKEEVLQVSKHRISEFRSWLDS